MAKSALRKCPTGPLAFAVFVRSGTNICISKRVPEGLTLDARRRRWSYKGHTFFIGSYTFQFKEEDGPALVFCNHWNKDLEQLGKLYADWRTKQMCENEYNVIS